MYHDCSTCGSSCEHVDAKDLIAPLNKDSSIKHVYAIMSGKGRRGQELHHRLPGHRHGQAGL